MVTRAVTRETSVVMVTIASAMLTMPLTMPWTMSFVNSGGGCLGREEGGIEGTWGVTEEIGLTSHRQVHHQHQGESIASRTEDCRENQRQSHKNTRIAAQNQQNEPGRPYCFNTADTAEGLDTNEGVRRVSRWKWPSGRPFCAYNASSVGRRGAVLAVHLVRLIAAPGALQKDFSRAPSGHMTKLMLLNPDYYISPDVSTLSAPDMKG